MTGFFNDIRQSWRALWRSPSFTVAAVLTLGLGIGVTGAVYSVGNGMIWRPLPAPGSDRFALVYALRGQNHDDLSWRDYQDLQLSTGKVFDDLIAYTALPVSLGHASRSERVWAEMVSDNYFTMLDGSAVVGRLFRPGEATVAPAVVISEAFWRSRFDGNASVLGQTVKLNGQQFTVTGVVRQGFQSPFYVGFSPALWLRTADFGVLNPGQAAVPEQRGEMEVRIMGHLRAGVDLAVAREAIAAAVAPLEQQYPASQQPFTGGLLLERDSRPEPDMAPAMQLAFKLFLAVGAAVLLIACANVASLLLARAIARRREITVRLALGAGRGRLIRQLITESLVLAGLGGLVGGFVASWMTAGVTSLLDFATDIPFRFDFAPDGRVFWFTAAVTIAAVLAFGLVPALQASSQTLQGVLRGDPPKGARSTRLFAVLVAAQVALSCLLLVGAGLVVRSLGAMADVRPGFETRQRLLVSVAPGLVGYEEARSRQLYRDLRARLALVPGVAGVTLIDDAPLDFTANSSPMLADGGELRHAAGTTVGLSQVGADYFTVMGTPLLYGRDFGPGDTVGAPEVTIVSKAMAEAFWPGQSALGRVVRIGGQDGDPFTVIGVAADAKYRNLSETPQSHAYFPIEQQGTGTVTFVFATGSDPIALAGTVRGVVAAADPDLPIAAIRTYEELIAGRALLLTSVAARVTAFMGGLALALALIGLYGVVAYRVAQRRRELGIRLALGATNATVVRLMLGDGLALAGWGIASGVLGAVLLTRLARALLFGVSPNDPVVLISVVLLLTGVTLLASWIPARRAGRDDPAGVLRGE
jgi:predicted permease